VQACRRGGAGFIVHVSTQSAKLKRKGTYALTKEAADKVFLESGFPVTILRSSLVYGDAESGAFGSLVKFAKLPVIPVMGPGTATHWPIHADDLARAIEVAALRPQTRGQIYDVGGADSATTNELLDLIGKTQGRARPKVHIPLGVGLLAATVFSVLPKPPFTRSNVLGSNEQVYMDVERFFREFGFTPRRLADGLSDVLRRPPQR
jgi:NADH dehydrogenase